MKRYKRGEKKEWVEEKDKEKGRNEDIGREREDWKGKRVARRNREERELKGDEAGERKGGRGKR